MSNANARQGHAVLDLPSRYFKAMKIAQLLCIASGTPRKKMLEIGCGSGGISYWFGNDGEMQWDVESIDVEDVRLIKDGYKFQVTSGTALPFTDSSFDVVVTNHVIEHVGDNKAQLRHLREIRRVLRPGGIAYLAVPNRWMLVEPHYKLPLLSWLPGPLSSAYVRLAGKGAYYDCNPLTCARLEQMLDDVGLSWRQHTGSAVRVTFELERPQAAVYRYFLRFLPEWTYAASRRLFPTLIYTLWAR